MLFPDSADSEYIFLMRHGRVPGGTRGRCKKTDPGGSDQFLFFYLLIESTSDWWSKIILQKVVFL